MTAQIHDIADHRPHLMVVAGDGTHVIPRALIQSVVDGKRPSAILTEQVVQRIIEEWLKKVSA